jgi:hypothetical protein
MMSLVAAGLAITVGSGVAHAADGDPSTDLAYVTPTTGQNVSYPSVQLPIDECPAGSSVFAALMYGPGFPSDGQLIKGSGLLNEISDTGGLYGLQYSFQDVALNAGTSLQAGGEYRINTFCQGGFGEPIGPSYDAFVTVNSTGATGTYTADTPAVVVTPTTTTLALSPSGPVVSGTAVSFTATVAAASGTLDGTVQFKDGGTDVGGPVTVTAGVATTTATLPVGAHSITAVYSGSATFATSTSAAQALEVTGVPQTPTTTALAVTPTADVTTTTALSLAATVAPDVAGSVVFKNNGVALGAPVPVVAGSASLSSTVPNAGQASFTATFTPTDSTYATSVSPAVAVTVVGQPNDPVPDPQTIVVPVEAGQLTISTPYTPESPLTLPALTLNAAADLLSGNAAFENIIITDTRTGTPVPWTASADAGDLSSGAASINGQNVGLTGLVPTYTPGNALGAGDVVTVDNPAAAPAVAPADPGALGLKGVKTIATAAVGLGTVRLDGLLTVNAPTSTPAGTYTGIVTFTVG